MCVCAFIYVVHHSSTHSWDSWEHRTAIDRAGRIDANRPKTTVVRQDKCFNCAPGAMGYLYYLLGSIVREHHFDGDGRVLRLATPLAICIQSGGPPNDAAQPIARWREKKPHRRTITHKSIKLHKHSLVIVIARPTHTDAVWAACWRGSCSNLIP